MAKNMSNYVINVDVSKQMIFDIFYELREVSRKGGGTPHKKIQYRSPTLTEKKEILKKIGDNIYLFEYYNKLNERDLKIAPPPRPK